MLSSSISNCFVTVFFYYHFLDAKASDLSLASLFIVLKDHNNESLVRLITRSQADCLKKEAEKESVELEAVVLKEGEIC